MDPALVEYQSLRAESSQARAAQQHVIQWSLATFGVLFAAGLVVGSDSTDPSALDELVRIATFGVALPLLAVGGCLTWAGEQIRMERAGFYLRGRERSFWKVRQDDVDHAAVGRHETYPLFWENYIALHSEAPSATKQWEAYLGPALIYGGTYLAAIWVFIVTLWDYTSIVGYRLTGIAWVTVLSLAAFWLFMIRIAPRLFLLGRSAAGEQQE